MDNFELDLKIINEIFKGCNNFNALYLKIGGSRQKFSKHVKELVESETIKKITKDGKTQYFLNDVKHHKKSKEMITHIDRKISIYQKRNEKFSDKKLLQIFVKETIYDLTFYSIFHLYTILPAYETDLTMDNRKLKALSKVIKARIDILQKRNPDLVFMFSELIKNQLIKNNIKT